MQYVDDVKVQINCKVLVKYFWYLIYLLLITQCKFDINLQKHI